MEFIGFTVNIGFLLLKFQQIFRTDTGLYSDGKNQNFISIFTNFASSMFRVERRMMIMVSVLN